MGGWQHIKQCIVQIQNSILEKGRSTCTITIKTPIWPHWVEQIQKDIFTTSPFKSTTNKIGRSRCGPLKHEHALLSFRIVRWMLIADGNDFIILMQIGANTFKAHASISGRCIPWGQCPSTSIWQWWWARNWTHVTRAYPQTIRANWWTTRVQMGRFMTRPRITILELHTHCQFLLLLIWLKTGFR